MKRILLQIVGAFCLMSLAACSAGSPDNIQESPSMVPEGEGSAGVVEVAETITQLEDGLSAALFTGDDGFDAFLEAGGASSDAEVLSFLQKNFLSGADGLGLQIAGGGCSTISVPAADGTGYYFGRNFDWDRCDALVLLSCPVEGYRSISTVNTDFIRQVSPIPVPDNVLKTAALYAPLDGMNETGLCVSVNMIQDSATIDQDTDRPDLTTTTAVRLLLNQAATVEEAVSLLEYYDLHASFGYMVHFAIADAAGHAVAVEYIGNEMSVVETPVLTNFYLSPGEKQGIGTAESHTRFERLQTQLQETPGMDEDGVRDALAAVCKGTFGHGETTQWSAVLDQAHGTAAYYHREHYETAYTFRIPAGETGN